MRFLISLSITIMVIESAVAQKNMGPKKQIPEDKLFQDQAAFCEGCYGMVHELDKLLTMWAGEKGSMEDHIETAIVAVCSTDRLRAYVLSPPKMERLCSGIRAHYENELGEALLKNYGGKEINVDTVFKDICRKAIPACPKNMNSMSMNRKEQREKEAAERAASEAEEKDAETVEKNESEENEAENTEEEDAKDTKMNKNTNVEKEKKTKTKKDKETGKEKKTKTDKKNTEKEKKGKTANKGEKDTGKKKNGNKSKDSTKINTEKDKKTGKQKKGKDNSKEKKSKQSKNQKSKSKDEL